MHVNSLLKTCLNVYTSVHIRLYIHMLTACNPHACKYLFVCVALSKYYPVSFSPQKLAIARCLYNIVLVSSIIAIKRRLQHVILENF